MKKPVTERAHRDAIERYRIAEALLEAEHQHFERALAWGQEAHRAERRAWDRCSFLYDQARSRGATRAQLEQPVDRVQNGPTDFSPKHGDPLA